MKPVELNDMSSQSVAPIRNREEEVSWSALSSLQRSFWFLYKLRPDFQSNFNLVLMTRTTPALEPDKLRYALDRLAAQHPMLRACFDEVDGEPIQRIERAVSIPLQVIEVEDLDADGFAAQIERERALAFDIGSAPLLRVVLYRCGSKASILLLMCDHIICDGWSFWQLIEELGKLLSGKDRTDACHKVDERPAYFDYVAQEREHLESRVGRKQFGYWKKVLEENFPQLDLPKDRVSADPHRGLARGSIGFAMSEELTSALAELSTKHNVTTFSLLLSSYFALLRRLSGHNRLSVGVPLPNRTRQWNRVVGPFVNTVVLRSTMTPEDSVADLLKRTNTALYGALRNQKVALSELVERLRPERSGDSNPYFQTLFVHQKARVGKDMSSIMVGTKIRGLTESRCPVTWGGVEVEGFGRFVSIGSARYDLALDSIETGGQICVNWDYDANKYDRSTIERFIRCWVALLQSMVLDDSQRVSQLEWLDDEERHRLLEQWNATEAEYPKDKCIHELFEKKASEHPESIAVVYEDTELSYAQLNTKANRLAHHLRSLGVGPDALVAICVERSVDMIIGLLAILKAGGAYVPLDPAYPAERLAYMLWDSTPAVVLTHGLVDEEVRNHLVTELNSKSVIIDMDIDAWRWQDELESNPDLSSIGLTPEHLAYVMYTSGSTGTPKGVMVEHHGVCNLSSAQIRVFGVKPDSRVLQFASLSFDACVSEVVVTLGCGATLCLPVHGEVLAGKVLMQTIKRYGITHVTLPPAVLSTLPENADLEPLQTLITAGEASTEALVKRWAQGRRLINAYGPTETTVCATMHECSADSEGNPPIGRPIANGRIYLLDSRCQPVPIGIAGELHVGGVQVARGYLNRPDLTADRFIPDPFSNEPGARMYKTGDLGRWLPDGNIEFLGRNDFQVKIRGFRIELGEIEVRLMQHPAIHEAAVLAREDIPGDKRLVAYYTPTNEQDEHRVGADVLRAHLKACLPDYMVPAAYVQLSELPLTFNGKLDRKALPRPDGAAYAVFEYEAPEGEIETILARIWSDILQIECIGRNDNFFARGGNSLLAVNLINQMSQEGLVADGRDLFLSPTLAALAATVTVASGTKDVPENLIPKPIAHSSKKEKREVTI